MIANISPISIKMPMGRQQLLSYLVPDELAGKIQPGSVVKIPLGKRNVKGVVFFVENFHPLQLPLREGERKRGCASSDRGRGKDINLKPILSIISAVQLTQNQLDLAMWIHKFYYAPLGIVLKFMIPEIPKKEIKKLRNKEIKKLEIIVDKKLNSKNFQIPAISQILNFSNSQIINSQSNRLEEYINLIRNCAKNNKQTLILVPQIIGVETLWLRLKKTFADIEWEKGTPSNSPSQRGREEGVCPSQRGRERSLPPSRRGGLRGGVIGKLHSQLNMTEYFNNWLGFQSGEADVLIGTRQAILTPPQNLGLIIIDEYQDQDFKQSDQTPRFDTVEAAKKFCEISGAGLVLASSAPPVELPSLEKREKGEGLESGENPPYPPFQRGKIQEESKVQPPPFPKGKIQENLKIQPSPFQRGGMQESLKIKLPISQKGEVIKIVDCQNEFYGKNFSPLSNKLQELLLETIGGKKWAMLLVNRRGEAAFISCRDCGNVMNCPKCGLPLILHKTKKEEKLVCHHCGYKTNPVQICPKCGSYKIKFSSPGTQNIEDEIKKFAKKNGFNADALNIIRIDSDSVKNKAGMADVLDKLQKDGGIIIATQLAAKIWLPEGLDLIGFMYADRFLNRPDFRASERA
ncbi:MAG: hypothetical protein V1698_01780, partial [bacterium]